MAVLNNVTIIVKLWQIKWHRDRITFGWQNKLTRLKDLLQHVSRDVNDRRQAIVSGYVDRRRERVRAGTRRTGLLIVDRRRILDAESVPCRVGVYCQVDDVKGERRLLERYVRWSVEVDTFGDIVNRFNEPVWRKS